MFEGQVNLILELVEKYSGIIYGDFVKTLIEWETQQSFHSLDALNSEGKTDSYITTIDILFSDIDNQQNFFSEYKGIDLSEIIENYTGKHYSFIYDNIKFNLNTTKKPVQKFLNNKNVGFIECSLYFHNATFKSSYNYRNDFLTISSIKNNISSNIYRYLDINDDTDIKKCYHAYTKLVKFIDKHQNYTFVYEEKIITSSNLVFLGNKILVDNGKIDISKCFDESENTYINKLFVLEYFIKLQNKHMNDLRILEVESANLKCENDKTNQRLLSLEDNLLNLVKENTAMKIELDWELHDRLSPIIHKLNSTTNELGGIKTQQSNITNELGGIKTRRDNIMSVASLIGYFCVPFILVVGYFTSPFMIIMIYICFCVIGLCCS